MTNSEKIPTKRLNVTLTNGSVDDIEQLRALLEKRLLQRLSIAQVIKRLTKEALASELLNKPNL